MENHENAASAVFYAYMIVSYLLWDKLNTTKGEP